MRTSAATPVIATAAFCVALDKILQMNTFVRLLATIALYMGGSRFAHSATMATLRYRPAFLVDVLQRTIRMLAVADAMSANTGFASPFLPVDQHGGGN